MPPCSWSRISTNPYISTGTFWKSLHFYRDILEFEPSTVEEGFAAFHIGLAILDMTKAVEMIS